MQLHIPHTFTINYTQKSPDLYDQIQFNKDFRFKQSPSLSLSFCP